MQRSLVVLEAGPAGRGYATSALYNLVHPASQEQWLDSDTGKPKYFNPSREADQQEAERARQQGYTEVRARQVRGLLQDFSLAKPATGDRLLDSAGKPKSFNLLLEEDKQEFERACQQGYTKAITKPGRAAATFFSLARPATGEKWLDSSTGEPKYFVPSREADQQEAERARQQGYTELVTHHPVRDARQKEQ